MGRGSSGADRNAREIKPIQKEIDQLKQKSANLLKSDFSGSRRWDKQLQSRVNQGKKINSQIEKLERKKKSLEKPKKTTTKKKESSTATKWQRAGTGWYIGSKGHEIRENYSKGGFDIVKVSGGSEKTIKHYKTLKEARNHKVK